MRKTTGIVAIITYVIIVALAIILNPAYMQNLMIIYGPEYVAGTIIGELLIIVAVFWAMEKIYDKLKRKTT